MEYYYAKHVVLPNVKERAVNKLYIIIIIIIHNTSNFLPFLFLMFC